MQNTLLRRRSLQTLSVAACCLALPVSAGALDSSKADAANRRVARIVGALSQATHDNTLSFTVLPQTQTYMDAWIEYNTLTCTPISSGSWTVNPAPTNGTTSTGILNAPLGGGLCPGVTFPFGALYYTWTSTDPKAQTDAFTGVWQSPDYVETDTISITLASAVVQSADVTQTTIPVVIAGPTGSTGSLSLAIKGATQTYTATYNNGAAVGPGTYNVTINRPAIAQDEYSTIQATWNASTPPVTSTYTINPTWDVRGLVQNTVYIKVYESACSGSATSGYWTFDRSTCTFTATDVKPTFASQTYLNGTGETADGTLVHANTNNACKKHYPKGATAQNTFYTISSVTGTCGALADTDVAVYPNPKTGSTYSCGDQLLYVATKTNANVGSPNDVEDYCPICRTHSAGTQDHVDNYYDKGTCTAASLPNYWEANLGTAGGVVQVSASTEGEVSSATSQASYHDNTYSVRVRPASGSLSLSIEGNGHQNSVKLPPEVVQIQHIQRHQDRLIVVGDVGASISRVMVVGLQGGALEDEFNAISPAVSPDGRWVAFVKFYPPHGAQGTDDHRMIYDVTQSAADNRPNRDSADRINVGAQVYPGSGNTEDDNVGVADDRAHRSASLLFWSPDSQRLAFADQSSSLQFVAVRIGSDAAGVKAGASGMLLEGTAICAPPLSRKSCEAYLDHAEFDATGVRASFSGVGRRASVHRELQISYADLAPLK